jgi:biopolymer transport protein ExbB/TolQ
VLLTFALTGHDIDEVIFHVASVLLVPVLILALLALALVIFELGRFVIELRGRRRRRFDTLSRSTESARAELIKDDRAGAEAAVSGLAQSSAMASTLSFIVEHARTQGSDHELNKALADFDFDSQRRLGRTRLLVRAGPALGLMGTLIPLSPALTGLASGNTAALSENLRVAFSVTVVGLMIGAVAYGLSLSRDRLYGQDLSDLQYVAAVLNDPTLPPPKAPEPAPKAPEPAPQAKTPDPAPETKGAPEAKAPDPGPETKGAPAPKTEPIPTPAPSQGTTT